MKNNARMAKLKVNLDYSVIIYFVLAIAMIVFIFLPFLLFPPTNKTIEIAWIITFSVFSVLMFIKGIISYQTATLDENGISFCSAIKKITRIKWTDILKVDTQNLVTLHSSVRTTSLKWIVLYTAPNQLALHGAVNKKDSPPWKIIYNKKNADTLTNYLKNYRPDLDIKSLLSVPQKRSK